jgi:NAD(P)-dependent dehydrogenase (short-subunit alcohol dehydrogenase family)
MPATWVIGGTSGIGAATVELLRVSGRHVIVSGKEECNVMYEPEIEEFYDRAINKLPASGLPPRIDEVVYCAGINKLEWLEETEMEDVFDIFDVNVFGFMRVMKIMARDSTGPLRVVAVSSDAARRPMRTSMAYCASKAALDMAAKSVARERAEYGWRVNVVAPGMTDGTDMTAYIDSTVPHLRGWTRKEASDYEEQQGVVKRRGTVQEMAVMIKSILGGPDYLNGSIVEINGGR